MSNYEHERSIEKRIANLEGWRNDVSRELREWEEWYKMTKPFLEQLQADLVYRQRKHAESVGEWGLFSKIVVTATATVVCISTVGSFVLQLVHHHF